MCRGRRDRPVRRRQPRSWTTSRPRHWPAPRSRHLAPRVTRAGDRARRVVPTRRGHPEPLDGRGIREHARQIDRGAAGPCTASTARPWVVSSPPMAACTRSVLEAFGITSKASGSPSSRGCHHTMMSSSTEASESSSRWVYCARPGPILSRSLHRARLQPVVGTGALDAHRAEVRDVEHDGAVAAGEMLGDRARRVLERHLPPAERHHARAQLAVDCVERGALECRGHGRWSDRPTG